MLSSSDTSAAIGEMWERILRYAHSVKRPITICAAYTADAAAACSILCALLKNSLVMYNVQPVLTISELTQSVKSLQQDDDEEEFFVLVGIGATTPLRPLFDPNKHVVLVLDNHRPVHLDNLREELVMVGEEGRALPWLLLWQTAEVHAEVERFFSNAARKQRKKRRRRQEQTRQSMDRRRRVEESSDAGGVVRHRKRSDKKKAKGETNESDALDVDADDASAATSGSSDEDEEDRLSSEGTEGTIDDEEIVESDDDDSLESNTDEDNDDEPVGSQVLNWRGVDDDAALPGDVLALYYSAHCCGLSVAVEMHELAVRLSRSRDAFLWYAAIGTTDLFLRCAIDYASYLLTLTRIRDQIVLQSSARHRSSSAADGFRAKLGLAEEPQLFLLRHWSLWEAVWHGKWSAALLRLHHTDSGEEHLRELLARSGISIRAAQQSWTESSAEARAQAVDLVSLELARLEALTAKDAADFASDGTGGGFMDDDRLSDTNLLLAGGRGAGRRPHNVIPSVKHPNVVPTVTRSCGFGNGVSAFDACYLFRGLLCAQMQERQTGAEVTPDVLHASMMAHYRSMFWKAMRALDLDPNHPNFTEAVDAAKHLQSSVVIATSALMQRGVILSTRGLHYTLLNDPSRRAGTMDSFWSPLRLEYLAEHVAVALTVERGRRWSMRPLALCCAWPVRDGPHELLQIVLAHSGAVNGPNRTLPAVDGWRRVAEDAQREDAVNIQADPLMPLTIRIRGRDAASHFLESLYLRSAEGTRRESR